MVLIDYVYRFWFKRLDKLHLQMSYILCTFDTLPTVAGLTLPERYVIQETEQDDEVTAYGVVTDRRLINPQTINVLSGPYKGYKAFVYYGAYEIRVPVEDGTWLIPERCMYFLISDGKIIMLPGFYLGEEVFTQGEQTASGIYITPYAEKKEGVKIKLTNVCENEQYKPGDTVITVDPYQYTLTFEGKKYVKLTEDNIIGIERDGEVIPTNNTALIQYLLDPEADERVAENDRRRERRDLLNKFAIHYSDANAKGEDPYLMDVPEPKTVQAKLLACAAKMKKRIVREGIEFEDKSGSVKEKIGAKIGDTLLVLRNFGCILPNGNWLVNMDTILGRIV